MKLPRGQRTDSLPGLLWETVRQLFSDRVLQMSAALAYWSALSLAPLVVVTLGIAGIVSERGRAEEGIVAEVQAVLGEGGGQLIRTVAAEQHRTGAGGFATLAGILFLFFAATGVFVQLQDGLNVIWDVELRPEVGWWHFVRKRLISMAMVLSLGFLLLVSMVLNALLVGLGDRVSRWTGIAGGGAFAAHLTVSMIAMTLLFALIFRMLPDARIAWKDVWRGALLTAGLFHLGEWGISEYVGRAGVGSAYGAAGSLVVLLVWVYYSSLIVFTGAEFTQVYATRRGGTIVAAPLAHRGNQAAPRSTRKPAPQPVRRTTTPP